MAQRSLAKTTRPTVAGAIRRVRLFHRLDRALRRPLTWVWGPPGAGKTTLVASYLAERRLGALWYQVDAGDADAATIFYYLGRAAPRTRRPLPVLTPEYRSRLDVFARSYFRQLFDRLPRRFVLVLDNYQEAPADALLHEILRVAAEELPERGRIVVVSRAEPPAPLARLQVHELLDVIGWSELRLAPDEASRLADARPGVSREALRRLYELADGWIAGLVLLLGRDAAAPAAQPLSPTQLLFDYFAGEIFRRSDARTQRVLVETSFLPSVTAAGANELTGLPHAGEVVAQLHRKNYFTNKRAGADGAYEYHPLFREFLLAEARRTLSADRVAAIQRSAARILEQSGEVEAAADLLRDGPLGELILRHAPALLAQGRVETVERWFGRLPEVVIEAAPWLLYWRAVCNLGRRPQECGRDAERALPVFRAQKDVDGTRLAWALVVLNRIMVGWLDSIDPWIARLDELLAEVPGRASDTAEARVAISMLLAIQYRQPNRADWSRWAARVLELVRFHHDLALRSIGLCVWTISYWLRGDYRTIASIVDDLRALSRRRDVPSAISLGAALPLVWYEILSGSPSYRQTVTAMREHARATGLHHVLSTALVGWAGIAALTDGDVAAAEGWIREMGAEVADWGSVYRMLHLGLCTLQALARNDLADAAAGEAELARSGYTTGMIYEETLARVTSAYVLHERGADAEARAQVERALGIAASIENPFLLWIVRLAQSYALLDRARDAEGLEALRTAMALGQEGAFVNSPVWRPPMMSRLCARALEAGIEPDYVRSLIRRRRLVCDPPPLFAESWPWAVKVFTLGRFEVLVDEKPLRSTGKVQRKPLALLKALAVLGRPQVREERLMDLLWPESEGDGARRALTSTVFRLRKLLGRDAAIVRRDDRIGLNRALCWVDVWTVERLLSLSGPPEDVARWTEKAASLYRGPLLEDDVGWSREVARRLRARLARQLGEAVRYRRSAGQSSKAAELREIALSIAPANEAESVTDR